MPSGKVHDRITVIGAIAAAPAWWQLSQDSRDYTVGATLVGAILFSGLMLSPDLDLNSSIYHRWGPLKWLWLPYQRAVPHRSFLSHSMLGALLRVAYFLLVLWGISHLIAWGVLQAGVGHIRPLNSPLDLLRNLYADHRRQLELGIVGLLLGTVLHTGADTVVTFIKRRT